MSASIRYEEGLVKAEPSSIEEPGIFLVAGTLEDTMNALITR